MLNYAESNPTAFRDAPQKQVIETVKQHRQQLLTMQSIVAKIEERRNRTVAHLDKLHVNNPASLYAHDHLNENEAREAFRLILKILNTYAGFLGYQEPFSHNENSAKLAEDWYELYTFINPSSATS